MTEWNDEGPVLDPLKDDYRPTPQDAARVWAKLRAAAIAAEAAEPAVASPGRWSAPWKIVIPSCGALALVCGLHYGLGSASSGGAPLGSDGRYPLSGEAVGGGSAPAMATEGASAHPPSRGTSARLAPEREAKASAEPSAISIDALPPAPTAARGTVAPASAPAARDEERLDTLEEETRLLVTAARADRSGDPTRALALVEEHARRFPGGQLKDERDVQRIVALCALGQTDEATRRAQRFRASHGSSPLTRRIDQSCARR